MRLIFPRTPFIVSNTIPETRQRDNLVWGEFVRGESCRQRGRLDLLTFYFQHTICFPMPPSKQGGGGGGGGGKSAQPFALHAKKNT